MKEACWGICHSCDKAVVQMFIYFTLQNEAWVSVGLG